MEFHPATSRSSLNLVKIEDMPDTPDTFEIICPCCQAKMTVSAELRTVLHHAAPAGKKTVTDLNEEIGKFDSHAAEREKKFVDNMAAEANKKERLDRQFADLFKKAEEDDDGSRPVRAIDLD